MDILVGERGSGKTTRLIQLSAEGKGTIVTPTRKMAAYVKDMAEKMEVTIPDPISWFNLMRDGHDRKGPYLVDELSMALSSIGVTTATLDAGCIEELSDEGDEMFPWAKREIELAIASEKEAAKDTDDWQYGVACYESAMKAYRSLLHYNHSGMTIQITKSILNRLIDGKCLTPIEDTPEIWYDITEDNTDICDYQCARMSSLFKKVMPDGTVTYSDINRVSCVNIESPDIAFHNGFATRLIDKIFPITMPYLAPSKPFRLFTEEFLVDPKHGDFDTVAYLYILMPDGQKVELNRYFKEDDSGQMVPIEKEEFAERKAKKVMKK